MPFAALKLNLQCEQMIQGMCSFIHNRIRSVFATWFGVSIGAAICSVHVCDRPHNVTRVSEYPICRLAVWILLHERMSSHDCWSFCSIGLLKCIFHRVCCSHQAPVMGTWQPNTAQQTEKKFHVNLLLSWEPVVTKCTVEESISGTPL